MARKPIELFKRLDFLYTPSTDVAADAAYFTTVLGGTLVFAIEDGGDRVTMIKLTEGPPLILLADHLEGERPILLYRVENLSETLAQLESRGWERAETFEIPHGPCCSFQIQGGHRIAVYELTRPDVAEHFQGRFDF